jgi:hypothetical protein
MLCMVSNPGGAEMTQRRRFVPNVISRFWMTLALFLCSGEIAQSQGTPNFPAGQSHSADSYSYLDQGWGYDTAAWWYHLSQGTIFMPYQWFISLEQASGDELFAASDHLERLGFLADLPSAANPRGLPVGFTIRQLDFPTKAYWKGEWVGFGCAACHTGQLRYHGQQIRVEGGASHLDIETFGDELGAALAATAAGLPKFTRFVERVLKSGAAVTPDQLQASFAAYLKEQQAHKVLFDTAQEAASEVPTRSARCGSPRRKSAAFGALERSQELRPDNRAGQLPGALGYALFRLGAVQRLDPPTPRAQCHRGARRPSANRSEHNAVRQDRSRRADG